jgi:hypothetical protein
MRACCIWGCSVFFLALGLLGCGGNDELASVRGKVTLDGAPLEGAQVVFSPTTAGSTAYGLTDSNGDYEMMFSDDEKGAWLGENVVRITTEDVGTGDSPATKEVVPAVYNIRSTLKASVEKKANTFDFELKSDAGKVIQSITE